MESPQRVLKIFLAGEEAAGVQVLRSVVQSGHQVALVLTSPPGSSDRGATVWQVAQSLRCPTQPAERVKDPALAEEARTKGIDLFLNVHSLYVIASQVLEAPRIGAFNLHPGPLPRYAGLNAPSWALYCGERQHGVTIHWMAPRLDSGPIAYQSLFDLTGSDTGLSVSARCVRDGLPLVRQLLETASRDPAAVPRIEQDLSRRQYFGRAVPQEGRLAFDRPAREVARFIRAAEFHPLPSPWGHPLATLEGREVGVVKAALTGRPAGAPPGAVEREGRQVRVACADEWLRLNLLWIDGKYQDAAEALATGNRLEDAR